MFVCWYPCLLRSMQAGKHQLCAKADAEAVVREQRDSHVAISRTKLDTSITHPSYHIVLSAHDSMSMQWMIIVQLSRIQALRKAPPADVDAPMGGTTLLVSVKLAADVPASSLRWQRLAAEFEQTSALAEVIEAHDNYGPAKQVAQLAAFGRSARFAALRESALLMLDADTLPVRPLPRTLIHAAVRQGKAAAYYEDFLFLYTAHKDFWPVVGRALRSLQPKAAWLVNSESAFNHRCNIRQWLAERNVTLPPVGPPALLVPRSLFPSLIPRWLQAVDVLGSDPAAVQLFGWHRQAWALPLAAVPPLGNGFLVPDDWVLEPQAVGATQPPYLDEARQSVPRKWQNAFTFVHLPYTLAFTSAGAPLPLGSDTTNAHWALGKHVYGSSAPDADLVPPPMSRHTNVARWWHRAIVEAARAHPNSWPGKTTRLHGPSALPYALRQPGSRSYSQCMQDRTLLPLWPNNFTGFFVEAGAHDGETGSNTLLFETLGWRGLLVEPEASSYQTMLSKHRRAHSFNGVLATEADQTFVHFAPAGQVGVVQATANARSQRVAAASLLELLQRIGHKGAVDLWTLDIEGVETKVLEATDFARIEIGVLIVESERASGLEAVLQRKGLVQIGRTHFLEMGVCASHRPLHWNPNAKPLRTLDLIFANPAYFRRRGWLMPSKLQDQQLCEGAWHDDAKRAGVGRCCNEGACLPIPPRPSTDGRASSAPTVKGGALVGLGCCRASAGAALLGWHQTPTAHAIAGKRAGINLSPAECSSRCRSRPECTHFELNFLGVLPVAGGRRASCWLFNSGGHTVAPTCDTSSGNILCYAKQSVTSSTATTLPAVAHTGSVFESIYKNNLWDAGAGGGSGRGSTVENAAGASRILFAVSMALNVTSIIDAPCGALVWQEKLLPQLAGNFRGFRYLGLDVSSTVITRNRQRLSRLHYASFELADLAEQPMPLGYELIFSRDALQHNTHANVWKILWRWAESDAKWVLVGSYPNNNPWCMQGACASKSATRPAFCNMCGNHDISTGGYFSIDLARPPFGLHPTRRYAEVADGEEKHLYLYARASLLAQLRLRKNGLSSDTSASAESISYTI